MLYMCFYIGEIRYAIQARSIESVIPCVKLQAPASPGTNQCGSLLYKQTLIPVFDLCQTLIQRQAESALSTRILLLSDETENSTLCGIIVERATGTITLNDESLNNHKQNNEASSLAYTVNTDKHGALQLINLSQLKDMLLATTAHNDIRQAGAIGNVQTGSAS